MRASSAVLHVGLSLGLLAAASGSAFAQLTGEPGAPQTSPDTEAPPNVAPQAPQEPVQATVTTSTTTSTNTGEGGKGSKTQDSAVDGRPSVLSFGIGVGYTVPTDINGPNTTSVRLRLPSGLTFEPTLTLGIENESQDPGDTSDQVTTLELGTLVRIPLSHNAKFDFEGLVGAAVGTVKTNPEGDDNNTSTTRLGLNWGIAVNYWLSAHWALSASAYTPFVSYTKQTTETPGDEATQTNIAAGVIWDPTVVFMIHLFN